MDLLQIDALSLAAGPLPILKRVSFGLQAGEMLAVVGESGSGKTMIARAAIGLLPHGIRHTEGRIVFHGTDMATLPARQLRRMRGPEIGMVFQEPMVSLNPAMTVGTQMAEGLRLHTKLGRAEMRRRMIAMLERVRIRNPERALAAYPHEFSGGMRQRIMLASVMLLRPSLLIADEPTTALDMLSQREVLDLMTELARDQGTAVMLITHDLAVVERYAARAIVMRHGSLVEEVSVAGLLSKPRQQYTRDLIAAVHDILPPRTPAPTVNPPVLAVRNLRVRHAGRRGLLRRAEGLLAVRGVDLDLHRGEVLAVVGGSGSGKTTLGRAVLGLLPAEAGEIRVHGVALAGADREARRRARLAGQLIFQDPHSSLDPRMRIEQIVAEPLRHAPELDAAARGRRVAEVLDEVGLGGFERRFPHALSGGQRQRVAIARALVRRPDFIVADEPVSALDMTIRRQVLVLFRRLQEHHGFACLFISHDLSAVAQVADRVMVLHEGEVVEQGDCATIVRAPTHAYTRALLEATPGLVHVPREAVVAAG